MTLMATQNPQPNDQEGSRTTRVMAHLSDSLVSELKKVDPSLSIQARHSSLIQRRLRDLFPAFNTPTHPPYALMIRSAILGLKEETGSTEEAISEFIERDYKDLPWAHARILSMQLEKLCEIGELERVSRERYTLKVEDEVNAQCKSSEKRKRGKRKSNKRGVVENAEERRAVVLGKQSQQNEGVEAQRGLRESENQDSRLHLETCSSHPGALECIPASANPLSSSQLQPHGISKSNLVTVAKMSGSQLEPHGISESNLVAVAKMSGSLSSNVVIFKQDETLLTGHHHQSIESQPHKQIADHEGKLLLPSGDSPPSEQEPNEEKIDERCQSEPQFRGTSRGRGHELLSSYSNQPEKIKLPPTHVGVSSDINLGRKRKASSTLENFHDDQPQHYNEGSPKANLDLDPMSRDYEQKYQKRSRGRPRKLQTIANYARSRGRSPNLEQKANQCEEQLQQGEQDRGRGRGRRGRPPKHENLIQYEQSQQEDQAQKPHGRSRGRGRPPKLNENPIQYQEQSQQEDEGQQHRRRRGRGRPPKPIKNTFKYEAQSLQAKQKHVRTRGCIRPPKPNQHTNQFEEQLPSEDQAQGLVSSPRSGGNDNHSSEQKQLKIQSRGRSDKSESSEAKSPAGLRVGSESKYESGGASQSNVEADQNPWRLLPVARKVQGIDGCWPLRQNKK